MASELSGMQSPDPKRITREALLALFAGLSLSACSKTESTATAEKPSPPPAASAAEPKPVENAVTAKPAVSATEIAKPAGSAEKDGSCAPGGCAAGQCGGAKKK